MSLDASKQCWVQTVTETAHQQVVLAAYCDLCRRRSAIVWSSRERLCLMTRLSAKRVSAVIGQLESLKVIVDTGQRRGKTGQIKVYRLNIGAENKVKNAPLYESRTESKAPPLDQQARPDVAQDPERGSISAGKRVEFGNQRESNSAIKESRIRPTEPGSTNQEVRTGVYEPCRELPEPAVAPVAALTDATPEKPPEKAQGKPAFSKSDWWQRTIDEGKALGVEPKPGEPKIDFGKRLAKARSKVGADIAAAASGVSARNDAAKALRKTCPECDQTFETLTAGKLTCSPTCKKRAQRKRLRLASVDTAAAGR